MMFLKLLLFGSLCLGVFANDANSKDQSAVSDSDKEDYWQDEYDINWYSDEVEKFGMVSREDTDLGLHANDPTDTETNKEVLVKTPEDATLLKSDQKDNNKDTLESDNLEKKQDYDSYEIEDNRSVMAGDDQNKNVESDIPNANENVEPIDEINDIIQDSLDLNIELNESNLKNIYEVLKNRVVFRDAKKVFDSAEAEESNKAVDIDNDSKQNDATIDESKYDMNDFTGIIADPVAGPSQSIQEETKKILEEDKSNLYNEPENIDTPTIQSVEDIDKDTAETIYGDIGDDLKEIFSFWDSLDDIHDSASKEDSASIENEEEKEGEVSVENIVEIPEQPTETSTEKQYKQPKTVSDEQNDDKLLESDPDLASAELNDLMTRFAISHFNDIDIKSDDFDKNVAPIHVTLAVDQVVEVTSPNYPDVYPNNNIVDWIFSGAGKGVEFNITEFSVNGYSGDFMLVVPGGIDNAEDSGIVFSYTLNKDVHYNFFDVDKLFVRFESKSGVPSKGFKFSVRLLENLQEAETTTEEPELPIAEPSVQVEETLMVYLAGVNPEQFLDKAEEFRLIFAEMAAKFITRNYLELGKNTAAEVTQIVSTSSCNVHWTDFGSCTSVRVGVPLNGAPGLDERQLREMWESLVVTEPFSGRMKQLGIMEFALPSDGSTMTVWLVISVGVVLSAAMLAFALWRWNCTEDYTRMTSFGDADTENVIKKGPLDLFPASRQTMPPMYDEQYFDASTRVDMGGFTNKSYVRHGDFLPVDSDEETLPADRFATAKGGL